MDTIKDKKLIERNIIASNKLIAEFLGYKKTQLTVHPDHGFFKANNLSTKGYPKQVDGYILPQLISFNQDDDGFRTVKYLKFHKSYDWLIPVMHKIWSFITCTKVPVRYEWERK